MLNEVQNPPVAIVMDTSVLIAALRSSRGASFRLLEMASTDRFILNISAALALEYEAVGKRQATQLGIPAGAIDDLVDMLCFRGRHHSIHFRLRPQTGDHDDEFILELAFASSADYIVTHNVRDFRAAEDFGIKVVTPGEFLRTMELHL